ncbi:thiamine pyrophosphate-dependent enzyme [Pseudaquabacterium rugosum]|uniref:Thiamine pyrophosphate-dependent enzyme n=1 Tax=Pseudaquabacterium rugosum TaxID=2984194 RepID=A0ABU9BBV9_9BURK
MTDAPIRPAGHLLVEALIAQGVDTVFGVPGESYLAVLDGLYEHSERIRFITCRHEGGAAFMAEAQGKLGPLPGVCFVTRGPGAANAAIGLHTAFQDSTPMVLLVGQVAAGQRDREAFQELDYRQVFGPGTLGMAKWVAEVGSAERLPEYVARAFHTAQQGRPGPVVLVLPEDMLRQPVAVPVLPQARPAQAWPAPGALRDLRRLLLDSQRPLVIAGGSGWTAGSARALQRFAEAWQLPVACGFRFQDTFDNHHPNHAGDVGIGLSPALARRVREADLLIALGVRLGEMTTGGYQLIEAPRPAQRLVHIQAGAEELGRVYAADLMLHAGMDAAARALEGLSPPPQLPWADWTAGARADALAHRAAPAQAVEPLDLARVLQTVQAMAPADTVYTNGAGNFSVWLHRHVAYAGLQHHGRTQLACTSGAMGYGLPAAVAAALLQPQRTVVNVAGDGDVLMTSQEMATAVAHGANGGAGRLVVLVVDNGGYGTIRMHQERHHPGRVCGTTLHNPDFAALARAYGWRAARVERTADFAAAFAQALEPGAPMLIHLPHPAEISTPRATLSAIREAALQARSAA